MQKILDSSLEKTELFKYSTLAQNGKGIWIPCPMLLLEKNGLVDFPLISS